MAMRAYRTAATTPELAAAFAPADVDLSSFPTSDGKPMAENFINQIQMIGLQYALRQLLERQGQTRAAIGGNQFLYYNPYNKRDNLSPDVYAALDVEPGSRDAWFTWKEGKAPDIVFEIASPSTWRQDVSTAPRGKLTLYGQLGVREYYVYNPTALAPPHLRAFVRRDEGAALEEARLLPNGGVWSVLLGAELRPAWASGTAWESAGTYLRVIDPVTGAPIRVGDEVRQDYQAAREQVAALQGDNQAAREQVAALQRDNQAAREQVQAAREQVQAAREQVAALQGDNQAAREQVAALQERVSEVEQTSREQLSEVEQSLLERLTRIERTFEERLTASERARLDAEDRAR